MAVAVLIFLAAFPHVAGAQQSDPPVIETIAIPEYPYLARLAGTEGAIGATMTLDERCNITAATLRGNGLWPLFDAVELALAAHHYETPARFRPCTAGRPRNIQLSYVFSLEGKPTNEWSPTYTTISGSDSSVTIKITTAPANLGELGLERRPRKTTAGGAETRMAQQDPSMDFVLPRYPPLARIARIQGDVTVAAKLNSKCEVASAQAVLGHPLLDPQVLDAVRRWRFPSCATGGGEEITLKFHFVLSKRDAAFNDEWAPTQFEMIAPYEFQIKTADLALIIRDENL